VSGAERSDGDESSNQTKPNQFQPQHPNPNAPHRGVDARANQPSSGPLTGGASTAAALLLELAMDEKLLGRTWGGWMPFA